MLLGVTRITLVFFCEILVHLDLRWIVLKTLLNCCKLGTQLKSQEFYYQAEKMTNNPNIMLKDEIRNEIKGKRFEVRDI